MTAEERLNRVRDGRLEYRRLLAKIEELEVVAEKVTTHLSDMPKGPMSGHTDDSWARLIDTKTECAEAIENYLRSKGELEAELRCIKSNRIRTAMELRYVDCMRIEDIADEMAYDVRTVYRFLSTGRRIYGEVFNET